jgi:sugar lactone lactonase YvrE
MKGFWIFLALAAAAACGVLGWKIVQRQSLGYEAFANYETELAGKDVPEGLIEQLAKVDPALVVGKETARLAPGLKEIRGIAVGPDDRVYAAGDKALVVMKADGAPVARVELPKTPNAVAAGPDGVAYVGFMDHVAAVDPASGKITPWESIGPKGWITSVAVSGSDVLVGDFAEKRVHRFDTSGKKKGVVAPNGGAGRYEIPGPHFDAVFDPLVPGGIWVGHTGRRRMERYGPDGKAAESWGKSSPLIDGFCGCCNPSHFAMRKDGSFVTAEKGLNRVKLYSRSGDLLGVVAAAKDFEKDVSGELDVAVDSQDRILVVDAAKNAAPTVRVYGVPPAKP